MKERPILFSAPMVRALLAGTKTQTRRIIKPQPGPEFWDHRGYELVICDDGLMRFAWKEDGKVSPHSPEVRCPYGHRGDRLWVRESIKFDPGFIDDATIRYEDGTSTALGPMSGKVLGAGLATYFRLLDKAKAKGKSIGVPSIHMPRWASRINLEITGVRVERLQGISDSDANAEGVEFDGGYFKDYTRSEFRLSTAQGSFHSLWESINGPDSWYANPWVWVVEFKRVLP